MVPTDTPGQYWNVLDAFSEHVAVLGRDGVIVAVNAAWEHFAVQNGGDLASCGVGSNYLAACQNDETDQDARTAFDGITSVLNGSRPFFTMEYPCHIADERRWFSMTVRPLRWSDRGGAVVIHTDITPLHVAKEREGHEQRRFAALIEHAVDLITVLDQDGMIAYRSAAFERELGYAMDAAGTDMFAVLHPDDVKLFRTALADVTLLSTTSIRREYRVRHRDGSWRWIEADLTNRLNNPDIGGIVVNSRDVTARVEAELDRAQRAESFSTLFNATAEAMVIHDGTVFVTVNAAYSALIGLAPDQVSGKPILELVAPESRALALEKMRSRSETPYDLVACRADGSTFVVELLGRPIRYEDRWLRLLTVRDVTKLRTDQEALRISEERLRLALEATDIGVYLWDPETDRTDADSRLLQMIGLHGSDEFSLNAAISRHISVRDGERYAAAVTAMLDPSGPGRLAEEVRWTGTDGNERWLAFSGQSFFEGTGSARRVVRVIGCVFDITTRKRVEQALRASEVRFRALVQDASDIVVVLDTEGQLRYGSQALERVLGYSAASFGDASCLEMAHPDDRGALARAWQSVIQLPGSRAQVTYRARRVDGNWIWLDGIMTNLLDVPEVAGIVINVHDVTEQKRLESQLRHLALHDSLTGLPNRTLLADRTEQAIRQMAGTCPRVGLLFLDVDYFKHVNDTFGHAVGDKVLQAVANRLRSVVQITETLARIGGDEFVILIPGIENDLYAKKLAERIQEAMTVPIVLNGHEVVVSVTIGIALSEPGPECLETLLRDGDAALYRAKHAGRGRSVVHVSEMTGNANRRWRLKTDVGGAGERGELIMHYQPIVTLASGEVTAMEALLRWQHPIYGLISPEEFIPLAEEAGQIVALGQWGLAKVCELLNHWGPHAPQIGLNLSATQFNDPILVSSLVAQVAQTGIDPRKLRLEVTEHIVIEDIVGTVSILNQLRNLGVDVSIDDFGSGYSSLRYLRELPVTGVKVDRAFMRDLETHPGAQALFRGIVSLAHAIGLSVTAEGIETAGQLALVRTIGCDQGQGFLLAHPGPVSLGKPPFLTNEDTMDKGERWDVT